MATHHVIAVQCLHSALEVPALGFSAYSLSCILSCPSLAAIKNEESPLCHLQETKPEKSPGAKAESDLLGAGRHTNTLRRLQRSAGSSGFR